jgi:hypothetical protein
MPADRIVLMFDIDETLIDTEGTNASSRRLTFDELYGLPPTSGGRWRPQRTQTGRCKAWQSAFARTS